MSNGFLLDTNVPSEMLRPRPEANVVNWVKRQAEETLFVSVVTLGELRRGITLLAEQSSRRVELERMIHEKVPSWFQERILPITRTIAEQWEYSMNGYSTAVPCVFPLPSHTSV